MPMQPKIPLDPTTVTTVPEDLKDIQPRPSQVCNCDEIGFNTNGSWRKLVCIYKLLTGDRVCRTHTEEISPFFYTAFIFAIGLFHLQMRISFPFLLAKDSRRFLLIMRTCTFFAFLYVGGTYASSVYTWCKNTFYMISLLIVFLAANRGESNVMEKISKQDSNKT